MKKLLSLIVFLAAAYICPAQEKLYYFINPADSLVGVKNSSGKVIIPAKYNFAYQQIESVDRPITEATIYFLDWENNPTCIPALSAGDVYDRTGSLLYHPMQYDNGPDIFTEGLTRCVSKGHKAGFANANGKIVIKAEYDWVSEFNYGYAFVCHGCTLDLEKDPEQRITVSTDRAVPMTQELMAYPLLPLFSDGRDTYS
ncbi:MAG: WG repeat-containing protein, partial [Sphingobacteriales bacterium]